MSFKNSPSLVAWGSCVGKKEKEGPLGAHFNNFDKDTSFGEKTWERSESRLQQRAMDAALAAGNLTASDIGAVFGGDLQAQCTASHYHMSGRDAPFVGLYGACSTMSQSLLTACAFVNAGYMERAAAVTSSHFCAAERQFRFPLEYGGMRTPSSQWTATAAGCVVVGAGGGVAARDGLYGRIVDYGIKDINNMGAAMAPAAADALLRYLAASGSSVSDFDLIVTGDLGTVGSELYRKLLLNDGVRLRNHYDCGSHLYKLDSACVRSGGSGCGCSACVLCSVLLPRLVSGEYDSILFCATGALMSTVLYQQKATIPAISHIVSLHRAL